MHVLKDLHRSSFKYGQSPNICVLACSDSRVPPPEIIFDQSLGKVFTIRVAGNILQGATRGSLEYAVKHLNVSIAKISLNPVYKIISIFKTSTLMIKLNVMYG